MESATIAKQRFSAAAVRFGIVRCRVLLWDDAYAPIVEAYRAATRSPSLPAASTRQFQTVQKQLLGSVRIDLEFPVSIARSAGTVVALLDEAHKLPVGRATPPFDDAVLVSRMPWIAAVLSRHGQSLVPFGLEEESAGIITWHGLQTASVAEAETADVPLSWLGNPPRLWVATIDDLLTACTETCEWLLGDTGDTSGGQPEEKPNPTSGVRPPDEHSKAAAAAYRSHCQGSSPTPLKTWLRDWHEQHEDEIPYGFDNLYKKVQPWVSGDR